MPVYIYNSLSRKKEEFIPLDPSVVTIYACGPTVYDQPHIGHARSAYIFDVIRRYLKYRGYQIKFVRNVTDVDDKIIDKAKKEYPDEDLNVSFKKVAEKYLASYHTALKALGIDDSGIVEPKASEYIAKMISFIQVLIDKGAAYASGGDVYFDIKKAKNYGKLSHQSLEKMEAGARVAVGENKRDSLDFALWKSAKEGEPSWDSPWGKGRPGWHIECSVMSSDILGDAFDIHGGGLDLIFPHHENEIAQSEGAGKRFAKYWIHHGLLTINSQKMAKSLGNFVTVEDLLVRYSPDVLKLFFLQTHYSQPIDFTWDRMEEKQSALETIRSCLKRIKKTREGEEIAIKALIKGTISPQKLREEIGWFKNEFENAMDRDFDMPNAVAVLFEIRRLCDKVLYSSVYTKEYLSVLEYAERAIKELGSILGLTLEAEDAQLSEEEKKLIDKRIELKSRRLFKEADLIRKELGEKGIVLEDTKDGKTTWRRKL